MVSQDPMERRELQVTLDQLDPQDSKDQEDLQD